MNKNKFIAIGLAVLVVVFILVILLGVLGKGSASDTDATTAETQAVTKPSVTQPSSVYTVPDTTVTLDEAVPDTENTTAEAVPAEKENDPLFEEIIARAGYSSENMNFNQLVTVDASGSTAVLYAFEKIDGVWEKSQILDGVNGYVGAWGVSEDASEYASYTPKGLFSLGTGFGICDDPGTGLDYFKVTEESYWVDDVNSVYYNQYVEGTDQKDWESAEHLSEYQGYYDYCVFIEYNTNPVVAGKGSAFFLHVGSEPTAGCIAISRESMIDTLCWLQKAQTPHILIF